MSEDFLGIYGYDQRGLFADEQTVNRATIRLSWGVIGLVSEWLGCGIEDLGIVVLTHELGTPIRNSARTSRGGGGRQLPFGKAETAQETALKEGLPQY